MTLEELLAGVEERVNKATKGPWEACPGDSSILVAPGVLHPNLKAQIGDFYRFHDDAQFCAHAREDVPRLLALSRMAIATVLDNVDVLDEDKDAFIATCVSILQGEAEKEG